MRLASGVLLRTHSTTQATLAWFKCNDKMWDHSFNDLKNEPFYVSYPAGQEKITRKSV